MADGLTWTPAHWLCVEEADIHDPPRIATLQGEEARSEKATYPVLRSRLCYTLNLADVRALWYMGWLVAKQKRILRVRLLRVVFPLSTDKVRAGNSTAL